MHTVKHGWKCTVVPRHLVHTLKFCIISLLWEFLICLLLYGPVSANLITFPPHEKSAVALISKTELRCRTVHLLNISTLTAKAHRDNSMAGDSQTNFIVAWL